MKSPAAKMEGRVLQPENIRYTVAIPPGHSGDQPPPLVLSLHYAGHGTPFYGRLMLADLVEPALRALQPLIVAPDCPAQDWSQPRSVELIRCLVNEVGTRHEVDPERTLAVGYSMGGSGVWHLARRHPQWFAAGVVMAGQPPQGLGQAGPGMPLYVIHSRADELVPLAPTENVVRALQERGDPVEWVPVEGITHFETARFVPLLAGAVPWIKEIWATG